MKYYLYNSIRIAPLILKTFSQMSIILKKYNVNSRVASSYKGEAYYSTLINNIAYQYIVTGIDFFIKGRQERSVLY